MTYINDYEKFCMAFNGNKEEVKEAKISLFIQNWIIKTLHYVDADILDYSLKKLMNKGIYKNINDKVMEDVISNVVNISESAFRSVSYNMREKIIRENIKMPVYKVREINSYSLNWLSRQPGKTIRQKISSVGNSMMAVQRRMSLDTAENRLLIAFAKELYDYLDIKIENGPEYIIREEEKNLREELLNFLRREEFSEIRRWENLPPNNTLLSDQNYRKIWNAWNELKRIDERIEDNLEEVNNRLSTIFYIELLSYLNNIIYIPQEPLDFSYDTYSVNVCNHIIHCLDKNKKEVAIYLKNDTKNKKEKKIICLKSEEKEIEIEFKTEENKLAMFIDNEIYKEYSMQEDLFLKVFDEIEKILRIKRIKSKCINKNDKRKFKNVIVDLFSLNPNYIGDNLESNKLSERILIQKYLGEDIDEETKDYHIPCDDTNSIKMIDGVTETYTVSSATDSGSIEQMKNLLSILENYISSETFTYIFPDAYSELQLSMVHRAAKMVYHKVKNIPLSIGAAFDYQKTNDFDKKFKPGDFILVVNLIDKDITFTLLCGDRSEKVVKDIKEYKGVVWDRHPTYTKSLEKHINKKIIEELEKLGCKKSEKVYELFNLDGLKENINQFSIYFGNKDWYSFDEKTKSIVDDFSLDITKYIDEFLSKNKSIIKKSNIHIISVVDNFKYKGVLPFIKMNKQDVLEGCKTLSNLEKKTEYSLWHDHLPALAIKLMYGKFDLIENACVVPKFGEKQHIPINGIFTLPKNCKEYHFNLVQDENARKIQYEAVIKNPAFPLKEDTECELNMTYKYGEEEPYELIFKPRNSNKSKFTEAKVKWFKLEEYDTKKLKSPKFPKKLSIEELKYMPSTDNEMGYINTFEELEKYFKLIREGCYSANISETNIKQYDDKLYGNFLAEVDKELVIVKWSKNYWDSRSKIPNEISDVSFWLRPIKKRHSSDIKRYKIEDLSYASKYKTVWQFNKNKGYYQCIVDFEYEGRYDKLILRDENFVVKEWFEPNVNNVSFEVKRTSNGVLFARNIIDEDAQQVPKKIYRAEKISTNDIIPEPSRYFVKPNYINLMKELFSNNRSLINYECPMEFRDVFLGAIYNWVNLFHYYKNTNLKTKLFMILSLAAKDLGKTYYELAEEILEQYKDKKENQKNNIPDEIGCAFCDLSNEMQKNLYKLTLNTIKDEDKKISILSKAIWHNEDFVYKIDKDILLNIYLPMAIDCIGKKFNKNKKIQEKNTRSIGACLEFILGVMRLRINADDKITRMYLSLNNIKMQELYRYLELMVDNNLEIDSLLKIEVPSKGEYDKICDLIYVLLVYLTGADIEGEIRISITNEEDEDDYEDDYDDDDDD